MKYEKIIITLAVLTFVFSAGASETLFEKKNKEANQNVKQRTEKILYSIEEGDYDKWLKSINPNSKLASEIDKKTFEEFILLRKQIRQGNYKEGLEKMEILKNKLGLDEKSFAKTSQHFEALL